MIPAVPRIPPGVLRALVAAVAILAAAVAVSLAAAAGAPRASATASELTTQRVATERAIQRIYAAGIDQLKTTRGLKLGITDAQAAAIEQKYADQLRALRRSALQTVATAYGQSGDAATQYVGQTESRLEQPLGSGAPVMLAPTLYSIVQKMGQLAGTLTDQGIREMTQASTPSPSAAPATSAPSRTPSPSPSPSPTR